MYVVEPQNAEEHEQGHLTFGFSIVSTLESEAPPCRIILVDCDCTGDFDFRRFIGC